MTSDQTHVIVGASLAGAKAAETLCQEGFDGRICSSAVDDRRLADADVPLDMVASPARDGVA